MNINLTMLQHKIKASSMTNVSGDGWLEENSEIYGILKGRFHVGSYSSIAENSQCINSFIGRFSTIEEGVLIGYQSKKSENFSNHNFAYNLNSACDDSYLNKLKADTIMNKINTLL